jgi:hypothetical protein
MKKTLLASVFVLLLCAVPADAQIFRHPFFHRVIHSPLVQQVVQTGLQQVVPILSEAARTTDNSRILVDSSVSSNLRATETNLTDAKKTLQDVLNNERNKLATPKVTTSEAKGPLLHHATKEELLEALKKKGG